MAKLSVKEGSSGAVTPLEDVNLKTLTNNELITELVNGAVLKPAVGKEKYHLLSKENQPINEENKTLQDLGFKDDDTITVIIKGIGA